MAKRHEEKYLIDYRQYAMLKQRALRALTPDANGEQGSYVISSLYYDDLMNTALLEKQDGLSRHTKFRIRTYDGSENLIKLERKVKEGILTEKQAAAVTREQIGLLGREIAPFREKAYDLAVQMQAGGLRPVAVVRYKRDAFLFQGTDLRITFDRDLEVLPATEENLFNLNNMGIPVLDKNTVIMEIKYGSLLPSFVRRLTAVPAEQLSVSKYALCREKII